jgi:hypothetical protein
MLALGSAALVNGLAWLLAGHFDPNAASAKESDFTTVSKLLDVIRRNGDGDDGHGVELASRLVVYGVTLVAVALLSLTVATDVNIAYSGKSPLWLDACVQIIPIAALVVSMLIKAFHGWRRNKGVSKIEKESLGRTVTICVLSSILYGVIGTVVAGAFTNIPVIEWNPIPLWIMAFTVFVSVVLPTPILVALVFAVPRFLTRGRLASEGVPRGGETTSP